MATKKKGLTSIQPGTKEMADYLSVGYGMTLEEARQIIKERDADPHVHPYDQYRKAKGFLEAYNAKPEVISTRPGWKRTRGG